MKIAITGASGFLGGFLVNNLLRGDHDLFLFARSLKKINIHNYPNKKIHLFETDYSLESLKKHFIPFDAMVHLASKKYNPQKKMYSDYEINLNISKNLFKACEEYKIKNVIFSSSRAIYTDINKSPFSEDEAVTPQNPYALSKLKVEEISNIYDINCKSLRIAQLIGWGERDGFMFKTFLKQAMKKKALTVFGEGRGKRDYLYVKDAAIAIGEAIKYPQIKGVFNLGSGKSTSHLEFAKLVSEIFSNAESEVIVDRKRQEDLTHYLLDIKKIEKTFKWTPKYSLKNAFIDMKKDYEAR